MLFKNFAIQYFGKFICIFVDIYLENIMAMPQLQPNPKVSIIIPCYNHGKYIDETLASINKIEDQSVFEVIIIDDGSKDPFTADKLKNISDQGLYKVIFQENQGVSAARNNAIMVSKGEYILPVDADNRIMPDYLPKALAILEQKPEISVAYGNGIHFGAHDGIKYQNDFNLQLLMLYNYIDVCALFRKKLWADVGGYDTNMRSGIEDWEFWLHAAFKGHRFHHIDEVLFEYRVLPTSRNHMLLSDKSNTNHLMDYMAAKHSEYFSPKHLDDTLIMRYKYSPAGFIYKLFLKIYFPNKFDALVRKGKLRKYIM